MAKLLKILGRITGGILEWVLILIIFAAFAIRLSAVQTYIGKLATDFLSSEMDAEFRIGKVDIYFFDRVALDDVFVRDPKGDTLASLGSIKVQLSLLNLNANRIVLKNITLQNGRVGINRDSISGDYNYFFITDYFDSKSKSKTKKQTNLVIRSLDIENIHLTYDDYRKSYNDFGMDYDHLDLREVELHAKDIAVVGKSYAFNVEHLSAKEKCGLILKRLQASCQVGDKGILLNDLKINTFHSRLFAKKFHLKTEKLTGVRSFEDSVTFDGRIDSGIVNLYDVSLFAPALQGMRQKVAISATLTQKVKDLKISNIDLRTGKRTVLRGTLLLPDFRSPEQSFLQENIDYAYIDLEDLQALRLPDRAAQQFIQLEPMIERLGYAELRKTSLVGYWSQFVLASRQIKTDLGTVHLDNGLMFTSLDEGGYAFERSANSEYDVYIDSFNVGRFIDNPMLGKVTGSVFANGVVGQKDVIRINELSGEFSSLVFNNYNYTAISVKEGSFIDNVFDADIVIQDPNLELAFDGFFDLNRQQEMKFSVDIPKADLDALHFVTADSASLVTKFTADLSGTGLSDYSGTLQLDELVYREDSNTVSIPRLTADIQRGAATDVLTVTSDVANLQLNGKIDPATIAPSLNNALVPYLSAYLSPMAFPKRKVDNNFFDLHMTIGNPQEILALFSPELSVSSGSTIDMHYNAPRKELTLDVASGQIQYNDMVIRGFSLNQSMLNGVAKAEIDARYFEFNDSLYVNALDIDINGSGNIYNTTASWNDSMPNPAHFEWATEFVGKRQTQPGPGGEVTTTSPTINFTLKPSFFTIKNQTWDIMNTAKLSYADNRIVVDHLVLERDVQFIAINGVLSELPEDELQINVNDLHMQEFSAILDPDLDIAGNVSGDIRIATPFTDFRISGSLEAEELVISQSPIGDVHFKGNWDAENECVVMNGDLKYLQNETFDFSGRYYPYKDDNNLDLDLDFKGMDMAFANAFMDPQVVRNIAGSLKGHVKVTGKTASPVIDGRLTLDNASAKIELLGTTFRLNGPIDFRGEENAFVINNMPVLDEEGNRAKLNGYIYHTEYANWNCNLDFMIDEDRTDRFLVLNTKYKEDEIYYGRAYVTGTANIFVTEKITEILVDVKTEEGTWIDIPMYGNSEIKDEGVVEFRKLDGTAVEEAVKQEIDLSGVELNLNFDVTEDARLKLIFNEKTGDEITVHGQGDIGIVVNNLGDIAMTGTYVVSDGMYNFVMGPVKQDFIIQEGGSITWTSSPYNANLDLRTYNKVTANFADVGVTDIESRSSSSNQEIYCILELTQTLDDPLITLDIQAPKATEAEKAVLSSIRSNKDELQKQFFSLLLLKKFVPLNGTASASGGGLADVITNQINSFLSNVSEEVKLQVAYGSSEALGSESYEVSAQKAFGQNDKFVVRTTFGVANSTGNQSHESSLIGDMSLEYLINDDGTFRVNIFNESNQNTVLQDNTQGLFTQGVGLHYQEDFNTLKDFKLLQFILDWFRDEKHIKRTKRREEVSVDEKIPRKGQSSGEVIIESGGTPNPPINEPTEKPEPIHKDAQLEDRPAVTDKKEEE